ncbi:hypothetical protein SAMN05421595_1805 [Austwickia chelonae]|uniref:Uncharacterized protein n=1 Tax=Austwickia chelonae NBRC 105200 TaxID=1184607 RepID=K6W4E2_9MICO|nr:hypothetical protein [Austwickia chelonae]GAB76672.1 hypothetical protein AUCHE_02_00320 [Austwickia chelonae NBRC 105200]SEW29066.1 hypothetical protein SAMN05421595_1805 [Austwickia chelonae]
MPAALQRRLPEVLTFAALAVGALLLVVGLIFSITIGPSGRVEVTAHIGEPGVVVVGKDAIRASSVPVKIKVTGKGEGDLTLVRMLDEDARAAAEPARHTVIDGVDFLPRGLSIVERNGGQLGKLLNTDTFMADPTTAREVDLEVTPNALPQAALIFAGPPGEPRSQTLDVTMTWSNAAWFWQAAAVTVIGGALLAFGGLRLRKSWPLTGRRPLPGRGGRSGRGPAAPSRAGRGRELLRGKVPGRGGPSTSRMPAADEDTVADTDLYVDPKKPFPRPTPPAARGAGAPPPGRGAGMKKALAGKNPFAGKLKKKGDARKDGPGKGSGPDSPRRGRRS